MTNTFAGKANFKMLTYGSLILMLLVMLYTSKDFGISGDEMTQNTYGQKVYQYFATFGKDQSCFEPFGRISNAFYYGGFYDLLCVTVNKFSPFDPFDTRHFINAFFGFMIIFFAAKTAKFVKDWDAALVVAWLLFLSPRFLGECMNNPKDVPFALGMLMGVYYIMRFLKAFPNPTRPDMAKLAVAIGFAISIRVGGLLLIPFLGFAVFLYYFTGWRKTYALGSKEVKQLVLRCVAVVAGGYVLGLLFWPYGLQSPISNPLKALGEMSNFSTPIGMLYNDKNIVSDNVPWFYIPKWIFISTPLIVLLGIVCSPYLLKDKRFSFNQIFFLFFAALFPLLYVIYKKSALYDGWRHLFFIFPPLAILAGLFFTAMMDKMAKPAMKYAVAGVLVLGLLLPAKWCLANHPNEIVYFNELVGGIDGAYSHYETDYYMNSLKQASYRLAKMKDLFNTKDTVIVASNAIEPVIQYFSRINPKIACVYIRYHQRYEKKWDYALIYTRFIDKDLLKDENGDMHFPPGNTIDVVKADHTPLCAIVAADPEQCAYNANVYMKAGNYDSAIVMFQKALAKDPNDETSYINFAIALANRGRLPEAATALNRRLKLTPNDAQTYDILTKIYSAMGDKANAQQAHAREQELMEKQEAEK